MRMTSTGAVWEEGFRMAAKESGVVGCQWEEAWIGYVALSEGRLIWWYMT